MALPPENGLPDVGKDIANEPIEEVNLDVTTDIVVTPEDVRIHEEMRQEIDKLENEIEMLKQALLRKERRLGDLRKELGVTKWSQFKQGIGQKYHSVQSSEMYGKLSQGATNTKVAIGDASGRASVALKNFGTATAKKWQEIRESQRFQNMEGKLWATTSAVKAKLVGSKENLPVASSEETTEKAPSVI